VRKQEEVEVQMSLGNQLHLSEGACREARDFCPGFRETFSLLSKGGMEVLVIDGFAISLI
jgi:hypothetical protein